MFTDGLINCVQVIIRNDDATFTCHIVGKAPRPVDWILDTLRAFQGGYGRVTQCWVICGDNVETGMKILTSLKSRGLEPIPKGSSGGYSINLRSGTCTPTPSAWNASRADVGGWLTARALIDQRFTDSARLGEPRAGDYYEICPACNQ